MIAGGAAHRAPRARLTELLVAPGPRERLVARTRFLRPSGRCRGGDPRSSARGDVDLAKLRPLAPALVLVNIDESRRETADAIAAWPPVRWHGPRAAAGPRQLRALASPRIGAWTC